MVMVKKRTLNERCSRKSSLSFRS